MLYAILIGWASVCEVISTTIKNNDQKILNCIVKTCLIHFSKDKRAPTALQLVAKQQETPFIFYEYFAAQNSLDIDFNTYLNYVETENTIYTLPALAFLVLHHDNKYSTRAATAATKILQSFTEDSYTPGDLLNEIIQTEVIVNHDLKNFLKRSSGKGVFSYYIEEHINSKKWFEKLFALKYDRTLLINELRSACIQAGIDKNFADNLFEKFMPTQCDELIKNQTQN